MSIKNVALIIVLTLLNAPLIAQTGEKIFLDANFKVLKNEKRAVYYEIREGIGKKRNFEGKVTRYSLDNKLLQFVFIKNGLKEGSFMSFNNEDFTSVKGQYTMDNKVGSWFNLDGNGDYVEEIIYSIAGDELDRIDLKAKDNVYYEEPDAPATYDKGNSGWNMYLRKSLRYPAALKAARITGELEIHFRITKHGEFNGYHVLESPHPILTTSIVNVVLNSGKWQGAIKNNQLVNSIFIYRSSYNIKDLRN